MDIVIEGNRITSVRQAGWPGMPQQAESRAARCRLRDRRQGHVCDARLRRHARARRRRADKAPDLSYAYKLWLAHGVTTVRGVSLSSAEVSSSEKNRSAANEIAAPRIFNYQTLGSGWTNGPVTTPEKAREWVRWAAANNIDGIKFFNRGDETPEIITAAIDEAHKNKMGTVAHLSQNGVANFNAPQRRRRAPRHRHPLLRPHGIAPEGQDHPGVSRSATTTTTSRIASATSPASGTRPTSPARRSGSSTSSTRRRTTSRSIRRSTSTPRRAT